MVNQWLIHGSTLANQLEPIEAQLSLRAHGCDARQFGSSQFVPTVDMERKYGAHLLHLAVWQGTPERRETVTSTMRPPRRSRRRRRRSLTFGF